MSKITKAVIPAAGTGTRMKPITNYLPKSMLPLGRKPVLAHIVEELTEASIEQIAILAQSNQTAVFKYFMDDPRVELIIDDSESGPGGAILKAEEFVGEDDFVTIFADAPVKGKGRSEYLIKLMRAKYEEQSEAAIAIYSIPESEAGDRGVVVFDEQSVSDGSPVELRNFIEKPSPDQEVMPWAVACRYVLSPGVFQALKNIETDDNDERQLTPAIQQLIKEGKSVVGLPLDKSLKRYDTGNFEGYFEAFGDFAE